MAAPIYLTIDQDRSRESPGEGRPLDDGHPVHQHLVNARGVLVWLVIGVLEQRSTGSEPARPRRTRPFIPAVQNVAIHDFLGSTRGRAESCRLGGRSSVQGAKSLKSNWLTWLEVPGGTSFANRCL